MQLLPPVPDHPFTRGQASELGIDRGRLDFLLETGRVRRVLRGVYLRSDVPDTLETRARCMALVVRPFAVICDRTAAWLYGVDTLTLVEHDVLPPVETFVLPGRHRIERTGAAGGERDLAPVDVTVVDGLHVTTSLRTALDLGCALSASAALATLDQFVRLELVSVEALRSQVPRYFRRRGVVQLRRLIPLIDARAESPGESWTRLAIHDAGLPAPTPQHWVVVNGRPRYRLDLAYPNAKVAIEYDGQEFHDRSDPETRRRDEERRAWLRDHGWVVIVVTKHDFTAGATAAWIEEIRTALRVAA